MCQRVWGDQGHHPTIYEGYPAYASRAKRGVREVISVVEGRATTRGRGEVFRFCGGSLREIKRGVKRIEVVMVRCIYDFPGVGPCGVTTSLVFSKFGIIFSSSDVDRGRGREGRGTIRGLVT